MHTLLKNTHIAPSSSFSYSLLCLIRECNTLQHTEGEQLRKHKLELCEHCTILEIELKESRKNSPDYSERVAALEANIFAILKDFSLKEKSFTSEALQEVSSLQFFQPPHTNFSQSSPQTFSKIMNINVFCM